MFFVHNPKLAIVITRLVKTTHFLRYNVSMEPSATLSGGILWVFWFLSELLTKWAPATAAVLVGTSPSGVQGSPFAPIAIGTVNQPVSATQMLDYLQTTVGPVLYGKIYQDWLIFLAVSLVLSALFALGLVRNIQAVREIQRAERKRFEASSKPVSKGGPKQVYRRWDHVLAQLSSGSEQGWRVAILEADIMLKDLLDMLGYRGETMADQMKQVDRANFKTIDLAWEAHRARNRIAHTQGGGIDTHEARRVIGLYTQIFKEFDFLE